MVLLLLHRVVGVSSQVPFRIGIVAAAMPVMQRRTVVSRVQVYVSESDDPYLNLAAEEWSAPTFQKGFDKHRPPERG